MKGSYSLYQTAGPGLATMYINIRVQFCDRVLYKSIPHCTCPSLTHSQSTKVQSKLLSLTIMIVYE